MGILKIEGTASYCISIFYGESFFTACLSFRLVGVLKWRDADGRQRVYGEILCPRTP